jgi:hypothetical protein
VVLAAWGAGSLRGSGDGSYVNRNLAGDGRAWSWHVTRLVDFADVTAEILDGNPRMVETDLDKWIRMTHGTIGFWSYTVTAEIPYDLVRPTLARGN